MYRHPSYTRRDVIMAIKKPEAGPYAYEFTLPVLKPRGHSPLNLYESVEVLNFVLSQLNRRLYGSKGKKRGKHLEGFVSIEDHQHGGHHFHALLKHDPQMFAKDEPNFKELFYKAAERAKRRNPIKGHYQTYQLTSREHLYCSYIRKDAPVNQETLFDLCVYDHARYVTKEIHKPLEVRGRYYERWYFIGRYGISLTEKA